MGLVWGLFGKVFKKRPIEGRCCGGRVVVVVNRILINVNIGIVS
jgi:hypothetical protein